MAVTIINRDNFEEKVLKADKPVILDLWASWLWPLQDARSGRGGA